MSLPDGAKCATLSTAWLERTFWYPGPQAIQSPPSSATLERWAAAGETCIECPVFLACRESHWGEEYGIWGGTHQHERYLYRRRLVRALHRMTPEERAAVAARLFAMRGGAAGWGQEAIARRTGYSLQTTRELIEEHAERLKTERRQAAQTAREAVGWTPPTRFPRHLPYGDAWVIREGVPHPARYIGQSADGRWLRMSAQVGRLNPIIRWFKAETVDLRVEVTPVIIKKGAARVRAAAKDGERPGESAA